MRLYIKGLIRERWGSRRFFRFLFSYIVLVIMLLTIVSSVIYGSFLSVLEKEVEGATLSTLSQVRETVDARLREINRMAMQIAADPLLTPFMIAEGGYEKYQSVSELKKYRSANEFVEDIVIHYHAKDPSLLYAASGTYQIDNYFEKVFPFRDWGKEQFLSMASSLESAKIKPLKRGGPDGQKSSPYMVYFYPLSEGTALFLINENALSKMIRPVLQEYSGFVFVLDEQEAVMTQVMQSVPKEDAAPILEAVTGGSPGKASKESLAVRQEQYSLMRLESDTSGWTYLAAMPAEQVWKKVNETRRLFHYTLAAVLLLGIGMACAFAVRNYEPIWRLAGSLRKQQGASKRVDELTLISEAIHEADRENEALLHKLKTQASLLRETYLQAWLGGKLRTEEDWCQANEVLDMDSGRSQYRVFLFLVDEYDRFFRENTKTIQDLIWYSFMKAAEQLAGTAGAGYAAEYREGKGMVLVLRAAAGNEDRAEELANSANALFQQHYKMTLTIGIGQAVGSPDAVPDSYAQAIQASRYRLIQGGDRAILYSRIRPAIDSKLWYPLEKERDLVKAIRQGNKAAMQQILEDMMASVIAQPILLEQIEFICFDIVNTVMKTLVEMEITLPDADEVVEKLFVSDVETVEEWAARMLAFCRQVCHSVEQNKESKNTALLEQLQDYVNGHYQNPSIHLEQIADEFGFSPSYLTRYFKNQTGQSLMQHIDSLRMEKAKKLLVETDLTLGEMLQQVGYIDATNFIRKFKKAEGVTPMQYRSIVQGGGPSPSEAKAESRPPLRPDPV
ncbi:helix-turn-helix domain-containing protein [Paenibacillus sp. J31TS4]|uniref:helix-turn-helix domain-containing protein n=1 Tax=Paenibacillus sp. J31TS4 TaxID=2807195 RepID=UPI001BCDCAB8|nr:helix-turn-helix domain-containing protein [Paenibacillus sp. J31TS4]